MTAVACPGRGASMTATEVETAGGLAGTGGEAVPRPTGRSTLPPLAVGVAAAAVMLLWVGAGGYRQTWRRWPPRTRSSRSACTCRT